MKGAGRCQTIPEGVVVLEGADSGAVGGRIPVADDAPFVNGEPDPGKLGVAARLPLTVIRPAPIYGPGTK